MIALRSFAPVLFASGLIAGLVPFSATAQTGDISPQDRAGIEKIIREYLIQNPEVLQEALVELERRQQQAQEDAQKQALASYSEALTQSPHGIVVGNPDGDVTLVEFFDYNCGYCKRAVADVAALTKADPKLRVVLRDLPILGPDSVDASVVALAAREQLDGDKYFEFHTRLMTSRGRVGKERALAVAKEMGLDLARLQKDLESPKVREALAETLELGDKLSLTGTPAFVIGDAIIPGAVGAEPIRQRIASMRSCGKSEC
jgi:Protein-disulfide isomerase